MVEFLMMWKKLHQNNTYLCIFLEKDKKKEKFKDITNKVVTVVTLAVAIITLIILMSGDETTIDTTSSTSNMIGK